MCIDLVYLSFNLLSWNWKWCFEPIPTDITEMPRPKGKGRVRAEAAVESGENDAPAEFGDRQEEDMEVEATNQAATPNPLRNFSIEGNLLTLVLVLHST